jgi:hypothetical protein
MAVGPRANCLSPITRPQLVRELVRELVRDIVQWLQNHVLTVARLPPTYSKYVISSNVCGTA